jgi:asparaginyl-tRNA synthetase
MSRIRIADVLRQGKLGTTVSIGGWVRSRRDSKAGFSFVEINDGSCLASLQVVADADLPEYESVVKRLNTGASAVVEGELVASQGAKQAVELKATRVRLLGESNPETYPLQKKAHSMEFLREIAHLRPRSNTFGAVARMRNRMAYAIHQFFQERHFLYVHTPIITASDCEGAGEMFSVTKLDFDNTPRTPEGAVDYSKDFFGRHARLTVSGQLAVETYCVGLGNVYTFGPTFRAENSNTPRHLAEFWMIEPEMAFADLEDDMRLAEDFLRFLFRTALEDCAEDLAFFNERIERGIIDTLKHIADTPFEHLTYTKAIEALEKSGRTFEFPVKWGMDLQTEHERWLTEEYARRPLIVTDYPTEIKAFYMRLSEDGRTVRAMDVLVPKVGEIIGGSQREERLDVLEERIRAMGMDVKDYWWYLDLRRYGSVPHCGFGLGFERLIQFVTGMGNIRDVIPFPRTPGNAEF